MSKPRQLQELLAEGSELNIVCHNNPDPDCLASALALGRIAADAGIDEQHILYSGDISHQQNRAFVNLLDVDLKPFDPEGIQDRPAGSLLAFVDHSVPGANNTVPEGTPVDVVIDHHPADDIDARFVDHREEIGAAATIPVEYVRALDIEPDATLATAPLFAIRRETLNFLRGATREEYDAAGYLHEHADPDLLRELSTPSVGRPNGTRSRRPPTTSRRWRASKRPSSSGSSTTRFTSVPGRRMHEPTSVTCSMRRSRTSGVPAATTTLRAAKSRSESSPTTRPTTRDFSSSSSRSSPVGFAELDLIDDSGE